MAFQPVLQKALLSMENIKFMLRHARRTIIPNVSECDETHIHSCYEVYINVSGTVFFLVNDRVYLLEEGGVILTRPNDVHVCTFPDKGEYEHYCLWIEDPDERLFSFAQAAHFQPFLQLSSEENRRISELLPYLKDDHCDSVRRTAAFLELLLLLEPKEQEEGMPLPAEVPEQMQQLLLYMSEAFLEIQYIEDVCHAFHISQATLRRWFQKYTGITPGAFLESKKVAYAKQLLDNGETVMRAALLAGFSDCSRFIEVFKKKFGITPKTYQQLYIV